MELFFESDDRYKYLKKNWSKELALKGFCLISTIEYFPMKFEFTIQFFNPDNPKSKLTVSFYKVKSFTDVVHESEIFDEDYDYNQTEDPIDFLESERDGVTEYFIYTPTRELWWRTNEKLKLETVELAHQ